MFARVGLELISFYLRRSRWEAGRWRLLSRALPLSRSLFNDPKSRVIRTRAGFLMEVELSDWTGRHLYVSGEYEPATSKLFRKLLKEGDTAVDIGANVGYFTLLASKSVGRNGRVFAFEPFSRIRGKLTANVQLNQARNVTIRPEALSDHQGVAEFWEGPNDHSGVSSLRPLENASKVCRVVTTTFDNQLPKERVSFVKIDVEGAELRVLKGMSECLRRDKPDLIVEVTGEYLAGFGDSSALLANFLRDQGYRMFHILDDGLCEVSGDPTETGQYNAFFTQRPI